MLIKTQSGPFVYCEGVPLEINPNHWLANDIILALPFNRPVIENVTDHGPIDPIDTWDAAEASAPSMLKPIASGGWSAQGTSMGGTGGLRFKAPWTDLISGRTTGPGWTTIYWGTDAKSNSSGQFRYFYAKNDGGGATEWNGVYKSSNNSQLFLHNDSGDFDTYTPFITNNNTVGIQWHFAMGDGGGGNAFAQHLVNGPGITTQQGRQTHSANIQSATTDTYWSICGADRTNTSSQASCTGLVALDKRLSEAAVSDLFRDRHQLYRAKSVRRIFQLTSPVTAALTGAAANDITEAEIVA